MHRLIQMIDEFLLGFEKALKEGRVRQDPCRDSSDRMARTSCLEPAPPWMKVLSLARVFTSVGCKRCEWGNRGLAVCVACPRPRRHGSPTYVRQSVPIFASLASQRLAGLVLRQMAVGVRP